LAKEELRPRAYADEALRTVAQDPGLPCTEGKCKDLVINFAISNAVDVNGNPVSPSVAAQRVVALLRNARSSDEEDEPLGVVVTADLELVGLADKPVLLSWSMWQQGGGTRLYGDWLNENLAYRLEATTNRDTTSLNIWIPLPREPGPYFVRVHLATLESTLASADSEAFD
jgi:hypothetical protein